MPKITGTQNQEKQPLTWDKPIPGETSKQYAFFCTYRDLGIERSIRKVAEIHGKHPKYLEKLSIRNHWVERARLFDAHIAEMVSKKREDELAEMLRRHIYISIKAQSLALSMLDTLSEKELENVSPSSVARLLEAAVKIERLSRGVPTEIQQEAKEPVIIEVHSPEVTD